MPDSDEDPNPPNDSEPWFRTMVRSQPVVAAVLGAVAAGLLSLVGVVVNNALGSHPGSTNPTSTPTPRVSDTSIQPESCSPPRSSWDIWPKALPALQTVSLQICPVDVNNGQTLTATGWTLSGVVEGSVPAGRELIVVSHPDPATCDTTGLPGNGYYYYQTTIDPTANNGSWQLTTGGSYAGSQTIRRIIYFLLVSPAQKKALMTNQRILPDGVTELADLPVQGLVPSTLHCQTANS
jgi:hypothetical protein